MTSQPITTATSLAMTSTRLTTLQRAVLEQLATQGAVPLPHAAPSTLASLVKRELIVRAVTPVHEAPRYALTDLGRSVLAALTPTATP